MLSSPPPRLALTLLSLELDALVESSMERGEEGLWRCLVCSLSHRHKARISNHVETHLQCQQFCPICQQACKSRDSLRKHMSRLHRDLPSTF